MKNRRPPPIHRHFCRPALAVARAPYRSPLVIYGLGNATHPQTKHSVGHLLLESLAKYVPKQLGSRSLPFSVDKTLNGWSTSVSVPDAKEDVPSSILFVKSKAPMNLSGDTAKRLSKRFPDLIKSKRLVVLHDDLSLAVGKCKGQYGGSAKGHNGIRDLLSKLQPGGFHRFRIGIGRPEDKQDVASWCMSPVLRAEAELVDENGALTAQAWQYLLEQNLVPS